MAVIAACVLIFAFLFGLGDGSTHSAPPARQPWTAATRPATGQMTPYGFRPTYTGTPMAKAGVP
ncbi:hypothetical protein [Streptomyces sp. NBC_01334]|uniref:hypothetical protein n=1 Tax=Streptomyces sp. NBC_01334 TaxID=2903827 RepID=UPI002E164C38|nr:hypothetical protein OG736_43500 [Streptomyces sp. NBC_01334]